MNQAVAVFHTIDIQGDVLFTDTRQGVRIHARFTKLPKGMHGFHIHKAGDLRGEGCAGACEHYDVGNHVHGDGPHSTRERHTGDLGNICIPSGKKQQAYTYSLRGCSVKDLWGRSVIVHEDPDDLGKGSFEDSKTTGHSGKRIGCALIGRVSCSSPVSRKTQRRSRHKN